MKFYAPKYKQLDLGLLCPSLDELDKTNRRVALGDLLPWTELEKEYNSRQDNQKKGAGKKPARMILSAISSRAMRLQTATAGMPATGAGTLATDPTFRRTLRLPSGRHPCGQDLSEQGEPGYT